MTNDHGAAQRPIRAAVVTLSDKASAGLRDDASGPLLCELLRDLGAAVPEPYVIPDDQAGIESLLVSLADGGEVDLILTTGGTGLAPRDHTPEATMAVADRHGSGLRGGYARGLLVGHSPCDAQQGRIRCTWAHLDHQYARQSKGLPGAFCGDRARSGSRRGDSSG